MQVEDKITVQTKNLYKKFDDVNVLNNINLTIKQGDFVAIMGSSGSGKTTLLNILSCMDTLTKGELWLNGVNAANFDEDERRRFRANNIGLIFQQFHLIPYLNALENVMLAQYYHSVVDRESALDFLKQVGLEHRIKHHPRELSGGEQQRVCVARALVNEPPIIFADEPTGNLDAKNEQIIMDLLIKLHQNDRTIIMVTHNQELGNLADYILYLRHGNIEINNKNG